MRINKYFMQSLLILLLLSGCKKDNPVETIINNNQNINAPQLIEPSNNSTINTPAPLLKWDAYENTQIYRVQLSLDANFITYNYVDTAITGIQLNVHGGILTTNVNYYWRVIANLQGGGTSNWSSTWRFSVILPPPPPPNLLLPLNNSIDQPYLPLFDWENSPTAQNYRLQVSVNSNFSSILLDTSRIPVSQLQCPVFYLTTNTLYFWRVNASNSNGVSFSAWSQVFSFRTISGPEPNSISGTIRFADTNFVSPPNYYIAGAYLPSGWPPINIYPQKFDSLNIQRINNEYRANYKIRYLPDGIYYISSIAIHRDFGTSLVTLGVYGCDTARVQYSTCPLNPTSVTISGSKGVENINILSWADTTKSIF